MEDLRRVMAVIGGGLAGGCLGGWLSGYLWMQFQVLLDEGKLSSPFPGSLIANFVVLGVGLGVGIGLLIAALVPKTR